MNTRLPVLLSLLLTVWASSAQAQVWTYEMISPDKSITTTFRPPVDLTYPAPGVPTSYVAVDTRQITQGTPLTAEEEAARRAAPQLIITTMTPDQAEHAIVHELR